LTYKSRAIFSYLVLNVDEYEAHLLLNI